MNKRKDILPKSQKDIEKETKTAYDSSGIPSSTSKSNRGLQRRVDENTTNTLNIGLKDIDETIVYYFNNVIKPSAIQNGNKVAVPIIYGSPERWASVQKDGFYRDKTGKIMTPLIMFKRDNVEKNRNLGNKLDANNPTNYGIFEKKYSRKNVYDRFSLLINRQPINEYYGVVIPDYVNLTYSCIIFTDYIEQMNKIIESINYASDSYWGDPERFKFRAMIDNYTTVVELNKGQDRAVKTTFSINMFGHIIPDSINAEVLGSRKFYSKSRVIFNFETADSKEVLVARAGTPEKESSRRVYDRVETAAKQVAAALSIEEIIFITTSNSAVANSVSLNLATFNNRTILTPPPGYSINEDSFNVYVNGVNISPNHVAVAQAGSNITATFNSASIGYDVESTDTVVLTGKFT